MSSVHNITIIGASFGGIPLAHHLLKDILPKIKSEKTYKVTLINPTTEFWWKVGSPRVVAKPTALPVGKALLEFLPTFEKYGADKFEFIQAYATGIEHATQTVTLSTGAAVHYDSLVLATGTTFASDLWSTTRGTEKLRAALQEVHTAIPDAQTIVIGGGGAVGVETAGEFGEAYGKAKEVTIFSGTVGLLNGLQNKAVGKDAQNKLEKMGVKVMNDSVKVTEAVKQADGKYLLTLSNGETKPADIYIDATGDKPNSEYVPVEWLNENKRVKTDGQTLRLDVPDVKNVYAIGTVASYSDGSIMDTKMAYKPLGSTIQADLEGAERGTKNVYKKIQGDMQFVPVGSTQGVGIGFGWRFPSFVIKMVKAKDFMIGNAPKLIEGNF